ncbi:MAG: S1 RNA-binding domain-containing protein [Fimbriiglobus sp.]
MTFGDPATWDAVKARLPLGTTVAGTVLYVAPFGVFVDLGGGGVGLLRVPEMAGDHRKQMADYPQVGDVLTAMVLWYDERNRQVTLTQRSRIC